MGRVLAGRRVAIVADGAGAGDAAVVEVRRYPGVRRMAIVAGTQAFVVWQSSQVLPETMCVADLPVAVLPLWQLKQVPMTEM